MRIMKLICDVMEIVMQLPDGSTYRGFQRLTGDENYLLIVKNEEVICSYYHTDKGEQLVFSYLRSINIDRSDVKLVHKRKLEEDEKEVFYKKKLVSYKGELKLFEEICENEGVKYPPEEGLNIYP